MKLNKTLKAGVTKFLKEFSEGKFGTCPVTAAAIVYKNRTECIYDTACNSGIRDYENYEDSRCIVNGLTYKLSSEEFNEKYCDFFTQYILYRSPWSFVFEHKEYGLENNVTLVRVDVPSSMAFGAMRVLRQSWENQCVTKLFYHLCNAGINENLALLVAFSCRGDGANFTCGRALGHTFSPVSFDKDAVKLFLSGLHVKGDSRCFNEFGYYENVDSAFGEYNHYEKSWFANKLNELAANTERKVPGNFFIINYEGNDNTTLTLTELVSLIKENQECLIKWARGE